MVDPRLPPNRGDDAVADEALVAGTAVPPTSDPALGSEGVDARGTDGGGSGKRIALIAGIVALVAATVFAGYLLFFRQTSPGGVVLELFESLEREDLLGTAASVAPSEHDFVIEPLLDLVSEAERLGLVAGLDRESVGGVDLDFSDLTYTTEELADDLVWVDLNGFSRASVIPEELPIGPLLERYLPENWDEEIDRGPQATEIEDDFGLAVVKENGTWYVSLSHTIAEAARREAGVAFPTTQVFAEPAGADNPAAALEEAVRAVADLDLRGLVDVLAPGETAAFRRYAALFMDDWDNAIAEARAAMDDSGFSYSIHEIVVGSGSLDDGTVAWVEDIPRFSARLDAPEVGILSFERDGDCVRVSLPAEMVEGLAPLFGEEIDTSQFDGRSCVDFGSLFEDPGDGSIALPEGQEELLYDMPIMGPLIERWVTQAEELEESEDVTAHFAMVEQDGRWFVSPMGTVWRWMLTFTSTLDEAVLEEVGDQIREAAEDPELFDRRASAWLEELQGAGFLGPLPGEPLYGPDVLAPFADQRNVLLVWPFQVDAVTDRIDFFYGGDVVMDVIDPPTMHEAFVRSFGPGSTGDLTPDGFPSGVLIAPVDVDTLVGIFNWFEILDLYRAADLEL